MKGIGWILWLVVIAVLAVATYFITGFHLTPKATTTIAVPPIHVTTTVQQNTTTTTANYAPVISYCSDFSVTSDQPYNSATANCISTGGLFGLWVASGDSGSATVSITSGNAVYIDKGFSYNCTTFFENVTLPSNTYSVNLTTGSGGGSCGTALVKLNRTTVPPVTVYGYIYNSNFSNGEYTGWKASSNAFGSTPFNITYADNKTCYLGSKWSNYVGDFFATNFDCGLATQPGNMTSSYFRVNPRSPYLNFKIISPTDDLIYIEVLVQKRPYANASMGYNMTPAVVAHFDTYNISSNPNAPSTFMNATIPLTSYANKVAQVRIVALSLKRFSYIAVGDFALSQTPNMQAGIAYNITQVS